MKFRICEVIELFCERHGWAWWLNFWYLGVLVKCVCCEVSPDLEKLDPCSIPGFLQIGLAHGPNKIFTQSLYQSPIDSLTALSLLFPIKRPQARRILHTPEGGGKSGAAASCCLAMQMKQPGIRVSGILSPVAFSVVLRFSVSILESLFDIHPPRLPSPPQKVFLI